MGHTPQPEMKSRSLDPTFLDLKFLGLPEAASPCPLLSTLRLLPGMTKEDGLAQSWIFEPNFGPLELFRGVEWTETDYSTNF